MVSRVWSFGVNMELLLLALLPLAVLGFGLGLFDGSDDDGDDQPGPGPDPTPRFTEGNDIVQGDGSDNIFDALGGDDTVRGGDGDDVISGLTGNDRLDGQNGNDFLDGGADDDRIFGGAGSDLVGGGSGDDVVWMGSGNDTYGLNTGIEEDAADTVGNDLAYGGAGEDSLIDRYGTDTLFGGWGRDTIEALDVFNGPGSGDTLYGGAFRDTLIADEGDTLFGGDGFDLFQLRFGADTTLPAATISDLAEDERVQIVLDREDASGELEAIERDGGTDLVLNGQTLVRLEGVTGFDLDRAVVSERLDDVPGSVTLAGDGATYDGQGGDEDILGTGGDDTITGGGGYDTITGGAGNDVINGRNPEGDAGPANFTSDNLFGGEGDDTILLDSRDVAEGGQGSDIFAVLGRDPDLTNVPQVLDFNPSQDVIEVTTGDDLPINPSQLQFLTSGDGTLVMWRGLPLIRLGGIPPAEMTPDVFVNPNAPAA